MRLPLLFTLAVTLLPPIAAQTPVPPRPPKAPRAARPPIDQWLFGLLDPVPPLAPLAPLTPLGTMALLPSMDWPDWSPMPPEPYEVLLDNLPDYGPHPMALWGSGDDPGWNGGALGRYRPDQGTPEDSLYKAAREALNRGEYSRASSLFRSLEQKYPRSRVIPAALYWRAFALYRSGATDELRAALETLHAQQEKYPEAAADADVLTLRTRLQAALAARGDAEAASALRAATAAGGAAACDREEIEVRAEALNALAQLNPPEAVPTLKKVLARRDECSVTLRRRAVYILGRNGTDESMASLLDVAKTDPDQSVRVDAIMLIGRGPGTATIKTLEQLFNESNDERTRQAALAALQSKGGPEAKRALRAIIERNDVGDRMRAEAIRQLVSSSISFEIMSAQSAAIAGPVQRRAGGDEEDAAYLRALYAKTESWTVKSSILSAVARMGGATNDQWVLGIAKNRDEDIRMRREALSRLKTTALSIDDLNKLFDSLSERELRSAVVYQLAARDEPAATDKLLEIARSGTDPQVRREAISALARRKDPRTTKMLLDLLEKP